MERSKHAEEQEGGRRILRRRPHRARQPAARSWACAWPTWRWMCGWGAGSTRRASARWPRAPGCAPSSTPSPTPLLPPQPQAEGNRYSRSLPAPAALVRQRLLVRFPWGWWCCRMCLRRTVDGRSSTCLAGEPAPPLFSRASSVFSRVSSLFSRVSSLFSRASPLSSLACRTRAVDVWQGVGGARGGTLVSRNWRGAPAPRLVGCDACAS